MLFAIDPDRLPAEMYAEWLGDTPWTNEQCKKLRDKMRAEGYREEEVTALVGDGSNPPRGVFRVKRHA